MCSSRSPPPIPTTASWARRWARRTLQASGSKARARPSRALRMRSAYWVSGAPAGVDAQRVEQRRDGVEAPRVVVVAGDDDGWYAGAVQLAKERVDQPLRLGRGRRRIEDVAGDEEAVGFPRAAGGRAASEAGAAGGHAGPGAGRGGGRAGGGGGGAGAPAPPSNSVSVAE